MAEWWPTRPDVHGGRRGQAAACRQKSKDILRTLPTRLWRQPTINSARGQSTVCLSWVHPPLSSLPKFISFQSSPLFTRSKTSLATWKQIHRNQRRKERSRQNHMEWIHRKERKKQTEHLILSGVQLVGCWLAFLCACFLLIYSWYSLTSYISCQCLLSLP